MAHLIYGKDELLAAWAAKRIPHVGAEGFGPCRAVGVATGPSAQDRLMAVCIFHTYSEAFANCQISMASVNPRWASKETIRALLSFPFLQYKVYKVWTATPHTSDRVVKFNERIGFKREAILRYQYGKKTHAIICGMTWPEYKKHYLPNWDDGRSVIMSQMVV